MKIIVLEGINGSGKSSLAALIGGALEAANIPNIAVDPTAVGPIGQLLRDRLVHPEFGANPDVDTVLFAALRAQGFRRLCETLEHPDTVIVLERWSLALGAYGDADGARASLVAELRGVLSRIACVDITLLIDVFGSIAMSRLTGSYLNRFELKGEGYLERVADSYRRLAKTEKETYLVDGSRTLNTIFGQVRPLLARHLPEFPLS
jgi:dTMP kinase